MSSGVQHKLLTYEVTAPPGVWNKIAAELDDAELEHVFPNTLYTAEVIPPAGVWNKIQLTLNTEEKAQQKSKRPIPLLRYAAAAVLIGLVAWGGISLLNKKSGEKEIAVNEKTDPSPKDDNISTPHIIPEQITTNNTASTTTNDPDEARNDAALEASKRTFAKLDINAGNKRLKNIVTAYRFALNDETDVYPEINPQTDACTPDNTDRYIMIMKPEGNIVRISKKLSHLVCCVSAENEDKDCKEQMGKWRNKLASSTLGHSSGSFLDLLGLIKSLQDQ